MPLYEYECQQCQRRFELRQKFSDPPAETCQSCGGPVRRLISTSAFQFKGSGWYVTDYARKSAPAPESASGDAKEKKEGKREPTADTKASAKSESKPKDSADARS